MNFKVSNIFVGAIGSQFPANFQGASVGGTNLASFRPQFTLPGQQSVPRETFGGNSSQ